MPTRRMCDLPRKLIREKILTRVPITSLRKVRSTCKSWDALTKTSILGYYATETEQFLGFATMNSKVCSLRFHLKHKGDKKDLVDLSMNQVDLLKKMEISEIFHCDGLLLCVAKDNSKLWVWNPYLNQTRCIGPRRKFHARDKYALGCDKILRLMDYYTGGPEEFEMYEFSSNSWRVLTVTPDWGIAPSHRGTTVKGRAYFFAKDRPFSGAKSFDEVANFLVCFDFTRDEFGPRLPLPFHSCGDQCVTLSSVGVGDEQQLAVLYFKDGMSDFTPGQLEIWVTTWISPDSVSWSKFLKVEMRPFSLTGVRFDEYDGGSFFIDEQDQVAVVFDLDGHIPTLKPARARYQTAFIIGEDGFFKSVRLGEAPNLGERCPRTGYTPEIHIPALVCPSAYRPSLVPVNQPRRTRRRSRLV